MDRSNVRSRLRAFPRWGAALVFFSTLALGCSANGGSGQSGAAPKDLDPTAAAELIAEQKGRADFVILDVRTPGEFQDERIAGAINIDFRAPNFEEQLAALDRDATYLLYCRTGNRSGQSLKTFQKLGFKDVRHLSHGITAWKSARRPTVHG